MKPLVLLSTLSALLLASCKDQDPAVTKPDPVAKDALASLLLPTAPANALTITEARKNPVPGTKVVLSGKVMGNMKPIAESHAVLTLGDPHKLTSCDLNPEDPCETPWDVCCDDPELRKQSIAAIQVLGDDGKPLPTSLRGLGDLRELSSLVVVGEVANGSSEDNFLVNATGIHVAMAEPTKENPAAQEQP